jgi:hypothetical protein
MADGPTRRHGLLDGIVVNYPTALPSRAWLRDKLLWAEHLGSIWPAGDPWPRTEAEASLLHETQTLREAGLFTPCRIDHDVLSSDLGALTERVAVSEDDRKAWLRSNGFSVRDSDSHDAPGDRKEEVQNLLDSGQFFYASKVGAGLQRALVDERLAVETQHGDLRVKDPRTAAHLMSLLANYAKPEGGPREPLVLDANSSASLVRAAAPPSHADWVPALRVEVPSVRAVNDSAPLEAFLDFRLSSKGDRLRQNYLASVSRYLHDVEDCLANDPEHLVAVVESMRKEVHAAGQNLTRTGGGWRVAQGVMTAVAMVVPVLFELNDPGAWAGFTANAGAAAAGVGATRVGVTHATAYSRALHKNQLVIK